VVTDYLDTAGLSKELDGLGFYLVGYGCTTCIGNSGPLMDEIGDAINEGGLQVSSSVLSGNRNFEGRVHQDVKANWLASPPWLSRSPWQARRGLIWKRTTGERPER